MLDLTLADVEARLRCGLAAGLPGQTAQLAMAPQPRPGWRRLDLPADARAAAALLLLFPSARGPALVLTERSNALPTHPGQISLPGGAVEPDEDVESAALREACEEVGLAVDAIRLAGRLTPLHIPVSRFVLHPVVGFCAVRPDMRPAAAEVEHILEAPLATLADPTRRGRTASMRDGVHYDVPYFDLDGHHVWGATAMILAELLAVLALVEWRVNE